MQVLRATKAHAPDIVTLEDIQHLQRGDTLPVGRQFVHVVTAVIRRQGCDPLRGMFGQIVIRKESALFGHVGIDSFGDVPFIKDIPATFGDHPVGSG